MKIRNGFVSNSSSSSFVMYGWILDCDLYHYEKQKELWDMIGVTSKEQLEKLLDWDRVDGTIEDFLEGKAPIAVVSCGGCEILIGQGVIGDSGCGYETMDEHDINKLMTIAAWKYEVDELFPNPPTPARYHMGQAGG